MSNESLADDIQAVASALHHMTKTRSPGPGGYGGLNPDLLGAYADLALVVARAIDAGMVEQCRIREITQAIGRAAR